MFLVRFTRDRGGVPLHFEKDEEATLAALDQYAQKGDVFRYLGEAISSTTFYTRPAMLIAALEAALGQKTEKTGYKRLDKDYMKREILKDDALFDRLYKDGGGIRNQLFHGAEVSFGPPPAGDTSLPEELYAKLVAYLNGKHGTNINTAVRGAPRNPAGNCEAMTLCLWPRRGDTSFALREVEDLIWNRQGHAGPDGLWGRFESAPMSPTY